MKARKGGDRVLQDLRRVVALVEHSRPLLEGHLLSRAQDRFPRLLLRVKASSILLRDEGYAGRLQPGLGRRMLNLTYRLLLTTQSRRHHRVGSIVAVAHRVGEHPRTERLQALRG